MVQRASFHGAGREIVHGRLDIAFTRRIAGAGSNRPDNQLSTVDDDALVFEPAPPTVVVELDHPAGFRSGSRHHGERTQSQYGQAPFHVR